MPVIKVRGNKSYVIFFVIAVMLFAFGPISRVLLGWVDGSFSPAPYSSLSLVNQAEFDVGVVEGRPVPVLLSNHTGHLQTYSWTATQDGAMISEGEKTLSDGQAVTALISSHGARQGRLRIALNGTDIFVTVSILKSGS